MDNLNIQILRCEGMEIAATIETEVNDEHPIYYPSTVLFYMEQGQFNLKIENQLHVMPEGSFFLIKKYTHGKCFKTWAKGQKGARSIIFVFRDQFLHNILEHVPQVRGHHETSQSILVKLPETTLLMGLMDSLKAYFQDDAELDKQFVQLKT
ncbi:MAG: hypothetical protein KAT15_10980, partial [Bacteroidales bacterium]|nr:hypothetical protein [Bacteroidales bacterium]